MWARSILPSSAAGPSGRSGSWPRRSSLRAWAWLMRGYHAFPVVRHSPDRTALRRAFGLLKQGSAVVLFPEGHRSENARLMRAEPGAGFIARRSGAPLVPIAITGTQHVLGRHQRFPRPAE